MKSFKSLTALVLCLFLLFSLTSCAVFLDEGYSGGGKHDNGNHNGWYKNKNNPNNPNSTNPGKSKGKSKN
jgi:uncharacterized lipoprotein YehR (DUF1307 family)